MQEPGQHNGAGQLWSPFSSGWSWNNASGLGTTSPYPHVPAQSSALPRQSAQPGSQIGLLQPSPAQCNCQTLHLQSSMAFQAQYQLNILAVNVCVCCCTWLKMSSFWRLFSFRAGQVLHQLHYPMGLYGVCSQNNRLIWVGRTLKTRDTFY